MTFILISGKIGVLQMKRFVEIMRRKINEWSCIPTNQKKSPMAHAYDIQGIIVPKTTLKLDLFSSSDYST